MFSLIVEFCSLKTPNISKITNISEKFFFIKFLLTCCKILWPASIKLSIIGVNDFLYPSFTRSSTKQRCENSFSFYLFITFANYINNNNNNNNKLIKKIMIIWTQYIKY